MKAVLYLCAILVGNMAYGQNDKGIFKAFKNQNIEAIKNHLASEISVCLNDEEKLVPRSKAIDRISKFLNNLGSFDLSQRHTGSSKASNYNVATIHSTKGKYRLFVYFERINKKRKITEIRIDKM